MNVYMDITHCYKLTAILSKLKSSYKVMSRLCDCNMHMYA